MARPTKKRRVCKTPNHLRFIPAPESESGRNADAVILEVDEYECIRLIDYAGKTQEECAGQMNMMRTSITAIYARARKKIADSLVNGKELRIEGGDYETCNGSMEDCKYRGSCSCECAAQAE